MMEKTTYEGFTVWYEELCLFGTECIIEDASGKPIKHIYHGKNAQDIIDKAEVFIDEYLSAASLHIPGVDGYPFRYNRNDWSLNDYGEMVLKQHGVSCGWSGGKLWLCNGHRCVRPVEYVLLTEATEDEPELWTVM